MLITILSLSVLILLVLLIMSLWYGFTQWLTIRQLRIELTSETRRCQMYFDWYCDETDKVIKLIEKYWDYEQR